MTNIKSSKIFKSSLSVISWNIGCINNAERPKTEDSKFVDILKNNDIICLQETKYQAELSNFRSFSNLRKNGKKESGGVVTLVNNQLKNAAEIVKYESSLSPDILVIKLKQSYLNTINDIFIINTYIRPNNSKLKYIKIKGSETYEHLNNILDNLSGKGDIILCGDFNARIQTSSDYIPNDSLHQFVNLPDNYIPDSQLPRNTCDTNSNAFKTIFLDTILHNELFLLNGRTLGDFKGDYTCLTSNGPSVIDYFAVSKNLKSKIKHLTIGSFTSYSDHKPLVLQILCPHHRNSLIPIGKLFKFAPNRYKFPQASVQNFNSAQMNPIITDHLNNIDPNTYPITHEGSSKLNDDITSLLHKIADIALQKTKPPKNTKNKFKPWFSWPCRQAKRELKKSARILSKFPKSDYLRSKYYNIKKSYTKLIKHTKRKYFSKLNREIEKGKTFNWNNFKKLKRTTQSAEAEFDALDLEHFESFFKNLYSDTHDSVDQNKKTELITEADRINSIANESSIDDSYLNEAIATAELNKCIKELKNGKASSLDLISNEMIKNLNTDTKQLVLKLFNHCFDSGTYPWNVSIITPIHKKGDIRNADNYRAIAVGSCLGKLFSSILLNRLIEFRNAKSPDPINQLGFTKKAQTSDHLFTLSTIISKYKLKKRPIYSVFIDFRKAFDSICRQALFYKLATSGVVGKFYDALRYMYCNSKAHIKLSGHISREISVNKGTEQGHPLSPDLFKLFFKDLSPLLEFINCPTLIDQIVSHLLWADDLVILALDPTTLQNQLNKLGQYCQQWGVEINMTKTKLLIFNGTNSSTKQHQAQIDSLCLNGHKLERVYSYCYLGIDISSTGSFKIAIKNLKIKAIRALISLKRTIDRTSLTYKSCCILFDALVKPIMLYGVQIWFPGLHICKTSLKVSKQTDWLENENNYVNNTNFINKLSAESYEKVHLKFLKWVLGVHPKASNIGVWGETGRRPLTYECFKLTINYFYRLQNLTDNSILSLAFKEQQHCDLPWHKTLTKILANNSNCTELENLPNTQPQRPSAFMIHNGFARDPTHINEIGSSDSNTTSLQKIKLVTANIHSNFDLCWNKIKTNSPKLSFYHQSKDKFNKESYLLEVRNFNERAALTQLRISAHDLKIETGRYLNLTREERICKWCQLVLNKNVVENEHHFLLECDLYNVPRRAFATYNPRPINPLRSSNESQHLLTLDSFITKENNATHNTRLSKAIANMFKIREKFIESSENMNNPN